MSVPPGVVLEEPPLINNYDPMKSVFIEKLASTKLFNEKKYFYPEKLEFIQSKSSEIDLFDMSMDLIRKEIEENKQNLEIISKRITNQHPFSETANYFIKLASKASERLHFLSELLLLDENSSHYSSACTFLLNKTNMSFYIDYHLNCLDIYNCIKGKEILDHSLNRAYADLINMSSKLTNYNKTMKEIEDGIIKLAKFIGFEANLTENYGQSIFYTSELEFNKYAKLENPFDPDFSLISSDKSKIEKLFPKQDANVEITLNLILSPDTVSICKLTENDDFGNRLKATNPIVGAFRYLRYVKQRILLQNIMSCIKQMYLYIGIRTKKEFSEIERIYQSYFTVIWQSIHASCAKIMYNNQNVDLGQYIIDIFDAQLSFEKGKLSAIYTIDQISSHSLNEVFTTFIENIIFQTITSSVSSDISDIDLLRLGADTYKIMSQKLQTLINTNIFNSRFVEHVIGGSIDFPVTHFHANNMHTSIYEVYHSFDSLIKLLKNYKSIVKELAESFSVSTTFSAYLTYGFWDSFEVHRNPIPFLPETLPILEKCTPNVSKLFMMKYLEPNFDFHQFDPKIFLKFLDLCFKLRTQVIKSVKLMEKYNEQVNEKNLVNFHNHPEFSFNDEEILKILLEKDLTIISDILDSQKCFNVYLEAVIIHNNVNFNKKYLEDKFYGGDVDRKTLYGLFFNENHYENRKFQNLKIDFSIKIDNNQKFVEFITPILLQNELIAITTMERSFLSFNPDSNRIICNGSKPFISNGSINRLVFPDQYEIMKIDDVEILKKSIEFTSTRLCLLHFVRFISNITTDYNQIIQSITKNRLNWDLKILDSMNIDNFDNMKSLIFLRFHNALVNCLQNSYSRLQNSENLKNLIAECLNNEVNAADYYIHENYSPFWIDNFCQSCPNSIKNEIFTEYSRIEMNPINNEHVEALKKKYLINVLYLLFPHVQAGLDSKSINLKNILDVDPIQYTRCCKILNSQSSQLEFNKMVPSVDDGVIKVFAEYANQRSSSSRSSKKMNFELQIIKKPEFYRKSLRIEPLRSFYNANSQEINRQFNQELQYAQHIINRQVSELMTSLNPAIVDEINFSKGYFLENLKKVNKMLNNISPNKLIQTWTAYLSNVISDASENEVKLIVFDTFRKIVLETIEHTYSFSTSLKLNDQILLLNSLQDTIYRKTKTGNTQKINFERIFRHEYQKLISDLHDIKRNTNISFTAKRSEIVDIGKNNVEKHIDLKDLSRMNANEYIEHQKTKIEKIKEDIEKLRKEINYLRVFNVISPLGIKSRYSKILNNMKIELKAMTTSHLYERQTSITNANEIEAAMRVELNRLTKAEFETEDLAEKLEIAKHDTEKQIGDNKLVQNSIDELEKKIKEFGVIDKENRLLFEKLVKSQNELEELVEDSEELDKLFENEVREPMSKVDGIRKQIAVNFRIKQAGERQLKVKAIKEENERIKLENQRLKDKIAALMKSRETKQQKPAPINVNAKKSFSPKLMISPRRIIAPKFSK